MGGQRLDILSVSARSSWFGVLTVHLGCGCKGCLSLEYCDVG